MKYYVTVSGDNLETIVLIDKKSVIKLVTRLIKCYFWDAIQIKQEEDSNEFTLSVLQDDDGK